MAHTGNTGGVLNFERNNNINNNKHSRAAATNLNAMSRVGHHMFATNNNNNDKQQHQSGGITKASSLHVLSGASSAINYQPHNLINNQLVQGLTGSKSSHAATPSSSISINVDGSATNDNATATTTGARRQVISDSSDSTSLPSSTTSTSNSMFKQGFGFHTWHKLWMSPDGSRRSTLYWFTILTGIVLACFFVFHYRIFGLNFPCGKRTAFDMNHGAEYYVGVNTYACGAWTRRHSIPSDESRVDTFSLMRTELGNKLRDLLEAEPDNEDTQATLKAKTLYTSCVNESQIERRGAEPLLTLLESKFGGWPLLGGLADELYTTFLASSASAQQQQQQQSNSNSANSANATETEPKGPFTWVQLMGVLRTYNNELIVGQTVGSHEHNSSMHAIRLYPASLGLPSADYYINATLAPTRQYRAYERYMLQVARMLAQAAGIGGADAERHLADETRKVLEFEMALANLTRPYERQGGTSYHRLSVARLQKYTPAIEWDTYFRYAFPDLLVGSSEQVGVYGLDYFMDVAQLIDASAKKTVINYLLWRFTMNRVNNLGKQYAERQHEYSSELAGTKTQAPRHKVCVDYVNGNMGMAVSALYVRRYFDSTSKAEAETMIARIREAFVDILTQVDWMDEETRAEAIVKARSMLQHIGFPTWILDSAKLDDEYKHLQFSRDNYFDNVIQLIRSFARETRAKLREPSERDKWTVAPSIINAHYLRTKNLMSFPAGILQPPIYHKQYPKSLNYGAIGSIIGHEITHGFDNDGRHHDHAGNQRLWWHPNTIERFLMRSQCMVRQYDDYYVPELSPNNGQSGQKSSSSFNNDIVGSNSTNAKNNSNNDINNNDQTNDRATVSGIRTLGENIADNGGLKEAFKAYLKFERDNGPEGAVPGVNLTHHQMFFVKFAQNWCQNMTPQSMLNALKTWRHPLGRFRVLGTLSNLHEFSDAFQCAPNTPMNPSSKCKVW
ncbi:Neprilysin-1 [Fragariocoptes setiger]|uniref:Neprilysin-1 n=1 Tax=Fragariocoptes setiger TaxID=1670756 RepID=A0ABQ7SD53_9ACAR|nr:Neprilysin-1 [Fragariocoptes setiger]